MFTLIFISSGWWIFNQWMLSKKVSFIFWNFILIFTFFLQISSNTPSFSLFFKFNIRFKNIYIFCALCPKRILLCVNKSMSQKLNLVTSTPHSLRWKSTIFHNELACPIRKSYISPNSIAISNLWLVYSTLSYFRS